MNNLNPIRQGLMLDLGQVTFLILHSFKPFKIDIACVLWKEVRGKPERTWLQQREQEGEEKECIISYY